MNITIGITSSLKVSMTQSCRSDTCSISYWNLKLRDDSNILDIANSIASESSGHLFSELLSASRTNLSAVSPINTGIVFIDIAIILSFLWCKNTKFSAFTQGFIEP